ncbi:N-acetylmuramoyl-L-alanine amidase [Metabacillus fastidiosus]|uniref:N-acetylmuramoyl-L-alanine amidase n=1 Tax=Metabacillus fastidiosus TaxID=1458 RepID=A0ABU6P0M4_9BACI|nr:N-acetylmuramoyl-L-alanine amidase [Metabacillus fastidiosus]MED4402498.1 N-acetylmuramoyl-L-alanine amidase [Metabacillus fastidiosus]MED4461785.1 N-acetylmuramoyl-L-alanine amidase [Metabacillus fastidiosus]
MKKIIIDAGHGGKDSGATGNGLLEKDITLTISKYLKEYLDSHYTGFEAKLTRNSDVFIELSERANISNRYDADVFISNHVNAGGGTGYESYIYSKPSAGSIQLQKLVNTEALETAKKYGLGSHGDDTKRGNLAVVRRTHMPAILTEISYIDSSDSELLKNDEFLRDMAGAYARGIAKFLALPSKSIPKGAVQEMKISEAAQNAIEKLESYGIIQKDYKVTKEYEITLISMLNGLVKAIESGKLKAKE